MGRSYVNIDKVIIAQGGTSGATKQHPLGLRYPAVLTIEDDPITIEKDVPIRNFTKFGLSAETIQCDYAMLKDIVEQFAADEIIDAHVVTAAQQATLDGRADSLKGNEVFNFWGNNRELGFGFKYTEEYSNGTKKTSCVIKGNLSLEKDEADLLLAAVLTDTSASLPDTKDRSKVNPGHLLSIEHPASSTLVAKQDIQSYKLEIETKGDGATIYGRESIDYLSVNLEIITRVASIDAYRSLVNSSETGEVIIKEKIATDVEVHKHFLGDAVGRIVKSDIGDKRFLTINFKGNVPVLNVTFSTTAGPPEVNKIEFGA